MGVDIGVWKLDWEKFQAAHTDSDSTEFVFGDFGVTDLPFLIELDSVVDSSHDTAQEAAQWLAPDDNVSDTTQIGIDALGSLFDDDSEAERFVGVDVKGDCINLSGIFSPAHVKEMAEKIGNIRWVEFSTSVVKASEDDEWLDNFDGVTDLEHYLRQWVRVVDEAASSGHGLVTTVG